jgi:hypothetical protein
MRVGVLAPWYCTYTPFLLPKSRMQSLPCTSSMRAWKSETRAFGTWKSFSAFRPMRMGRPAKMRSPTTSLLRDNARKTKWVVTPGL